MAYKNPGLYEMKEVPRDFVMELLNFKYLLNGHTCPVCKDTMLTLATMVQAFKIPPHASNQQQYGVKKMYCKENYVIVCGEHCAYKVREYYANPIELLALTNKLEMYVGRSNGLVKKLDRGLRDTYRDIVLKNCGIDPSSTKYEVYQNTAQAISAFCRRGA